MYRSSILSLFFAIMLGLGFLLPTPSDAAPLLQEGKKTLYQRVISHPTAVLYAEANEQSPVVNKGLRPFTPLYVFERGQGWLNVGLDTSQAQGWIKAELTTQWDQSLTLLFAPRTGRDPVVFFKDQTALRSICEAQNMEQQLADVYAKIKAKQPDPRIIASEPDESAVSSKRFYIMPILEMQEPYDGTKLLRVASIDPGKTGKDAKNANKPQRQGPPRTAIAFVIDTSISMGPYIEQSLNVVRTIYDDLEANKMSDNVGIGVVAFRSSTAVTPKLGYTSQVVSDFITVKERKQLEDALAQVKEAKASSHDFNEDSFAGVYAAIEGLNWNDYDSRLIVLLSDAGPLKEDDRYRSVRMGPQELNDFAKQKGIWIVALHVKTPIGKKNHAYAEEAYKALSLSADGRANYQPIDSPTPKVGAQNFAAVAQQVASVMVTTVRFTAEGKLMTRPKLDEPKQAEKESPEEQARRMAESIGYAMQLEYFGARNQSEAPQIVNSWITDMDLLRLAKGQRIPNVEVAVMLTKNQLSDLRDQIQSIIDNAERTKKTDSTDFFAGILSASSRMARDPNMPTQGKTLAELGVLEEILDGLPYRSEVMMLTEEDWYRKSIGEQTAFINRLKSRIARYEEYDRDRANWESFGMSYAGDWVYRVPLSMLP